MTIPIEILCLWELHFKRGDYKAICTLLRNNNEIVSPKQLVNYMHNCNMPQQVYNVFSGYYLSKEK